MNTPQTRFIALSAKKATNTEHTAINGNQSKCRISQFWVGGYPPFSAIQAGSLLLVSGLLTILTTMRCLYRFAIQRRLVG